MALLEARIPENVKGKYFVDTSCIDCDTCRCISPEHFRRSSLGGYSYVCRQPANLVEAELIEEALQCCPVHAIGSIEEETIVSDAASTTRLKGN